MAETLEAPMDTEDGSDLVRDDTDGDGRSLSRVTAGGSPLPVSTLPQNDQIYLTNQVEDTVRAQPLEESDLHPLTDH